MAVETIIESLEFHLFKKKKKKKKTLKINFTRTDMDE